MFASDIHGSEYYCNKMIEIFNKENADKLVLLGDLLYHGPRNPLPKDYNPTKVAEILNKNRESLLCVRGNCDADVDQMVLEFPIFADYMIIPIDKNMLFVTHGDKYNNDTPPSLKDGDFLIHGHTHVSKIEKQENYIYINPGSISMPKENTTNSYMILESRKFEIKDLNGNRIGFHEV